jgi:diadenosine tetraphosphate (Ap4A) HIT family hydrolase|tara:strand:- start:513 stop:938 length:426 start_codon:yes stop_codon:yes gene_type:complete
MSHKPISCDLCSTQKYPLIWSNNLIRVLLINDYDYPGYCRVDLIEHVKEMGDLDDDIRNKIMEVIFKVEKFINTYLKPDKINLASLGNITPHVHWHIIPRYFNDKHFPESIWSEKKNSDINEFSEDEEKKFIGYLNNKLNQ